MTQFFIPMSEQDYSNQKTGGYAEPPVGIYRFRCKSCMPETMGDKPVAQFMFEIVDGPAKEYIGATVAPQNFFYTNVKAAGFLKEVLEALGVRPTQSQHGMGWDSTEVIGRECYALLEYEPEDAKKVEPGKKPRDFTRLKSYQHVQAVGAGQPQAQQPSFPPQQASQQAPQGYAPAPQQGYAPAPQGYGPPPGPVPLQAPQGYQQPQQGYVPPAPPAGPPGPPPGYAPQAPQQQGFAPQQPQQGYAPPGPPAGPPGRRL